MNVTQDDRSGRCELLANASEEQQRRRHREDDAGATLLKFDADFETWAHENQLPPEGEGWRVWLMMAGRGFGKTRAGAEWVYRLASARPGLRIALVGATIDEARSDHGRGRERAARRSPATSASGCSWEPSLGRLSWPNGSEAQLFSGDNADGLRGPEHDFAWCDELAKWRQAEEAWDNLQFGLAARAAAAGAGDDDAAADAAAGADPRTRDGR